MPWLALPYSASKRLEKRIFRKFSVEGIPALVILDGETGDVINAKGKEALASDPGFRSFPWKMPSLDKVGSQNHKD